MPADLSLENIACSVILSRNHGTLDFAASSFSDNHNDSLPIEAVGVALVSPHTPFAYTEALPEDAQRLTSLAQDYRHMLDDYYASPVGTAFLAYVERETGNHIDPDFAYAYVGAVKQSPDDAVQFMAGMDTQYATIYFSDKLQQYMAAEAKLYGHRPDHSLTNTITHELVHLYFSLHDEEAVEQRLLDFFVTMAEQTSGAESEAYYAMARISADRYYRVEQNYRNRDRRDASQAGEDHDLEQLTLVRDEHGNAVGVADSTGMHAAHVPAEHAGAYRSASAYASVPAHALAAGEGSPDADGDPPAEDEVPADAAEE